MLVDPMATLLPVQHESHSLHGLAEVSKMTIARIAQDGLEELGFVHLIYDSASDSINQERRKARIGKFVIV